MNALLIQSTLGLIHLYLNNSTRVTTLVIKHHFEVGNVSTLTMLSTDILSLENSVNLDQLTSLEAT